MKSLDEIIKALSIPAVNGYHYIDSNDAIDALHYLMEYRMQLDDIVAKRKKLEDEIARYQEAVKKCEEAENKYRMLKGELEGFPSNMRMNIRW